MMNSQRKDKNEQFIIAIYKGLGFYVQQMDRTAGFDLLVHGTFGPWVVEVKSSSKAKLTDNEKRTWGDIVGADGRYNIVITGFDALVAVGLDDLGDCTSRQLIQMNYHISELKHIDDDVLPLVVEFSAALVEAIDRNVYDN